MKIAIPVSREDMETNVNVSFGRTPFFMVYHTETKETTFIENTAANSPGGAGIKAAQLVVDSKVDAILTPRCGKNATEVINGAKIKMYKTEKTSAKENIDAFVAGELSLLDEIHPGHGGGN